MMTFAEFDKLAGKKKRTTEFQAICTALQAYDSKEQPATRRQKLDALVKAINAWKAFKGRTDEGEEKWKKTIRAEAITALDLAITIEMSETPRPPAGPPPGQRPPPPAPRQNIQPVSNNVQPASRNVANVQPVSQNAANAQAGNRVAQQGGQVGPRLNIPASLDKPNSASTPNPVGNAPASKPVQGNVAARFEANRAQEEARKKQEADDKRKGELANISALAEKKRLEEIAQAKMNLAKIKMGGMVAAKSYDPKTFLNEQDTWSKIIVTDPYSVAPNGDWVAGKHAKDAESDNIQATALTDATSFLVGGKRENTPEFWIFLGAESIKKGVGRCLHCAGVAALIVLAQGCTDEIAIYGRRGHHMIGVGGDKGYVIDVWLANQPKFSKDIKANGYCYWTRSDYFDRVWTDKEKEITYAKFPMDTRAWHIKAAKALLNGGKVKDLL